MARVRLLFALFLVAVGTTFAALAISGYYEPHMMHGQSMAAPSVTPQLAEKAQLTPSQPRHRFVAIDDRPAPATPAKPKATAKKATPTKPKPAAPAVQAVREKRPQAAAAQWPWDLFGN